MKKLFVSLFFMILLMGTVSAVWEWDNVKDYDASKQEITVTNALGFGEDIATIKLDTPIVYNVIRGPNRLVAEFTITNLDDYENVFNDLEFFDVFDSNSEFTRPFTYKYKSYYNETVEDFVTKCKERIVANGTEEYDCQRINNGTHVEQKTAWINFDKKALLIKGEISIGIFTGVRANERVEWVPTLYGVRINEWAVWTDGLNVGLIGYHGCESTLNEITVQHNLGPTGVSFIGKNNVSAALGGYCNFTGGAVTILNTSNDSNNYKFSQTGTEGTVCFWGRRATGITDNVQIYSDNDDIRIQTVGLTRIALQGEFWDTNVENVAPLTPADWQFICATRDGTNAKVYINGTLDGTRARPAYVASNNSILVGGNGGTFYRGGIDEIGAWNRSLTDTEFQDLYNNGTGIAFQPVDTVPVVTINTPPNNTVQSTSNITFNISATDDFIIENLSLFINGIRNTTIIDGVSSSTVLNITLSFPDGVFNFTGEASDDGDQVVKK